MGSRLDMKSVYLSPGLASDEVLRDALPRRIALYNAGWDVLFGEEELARKRLVVLGKDVRGEIVEGCRILGIIWRVRRRWLG
jgi:hypothetical protein